MTDRDEKGSGVRDRMAERFQNDKPDENAENDENDELSETVVSSEPSELSETSEGSQPSESSENDKQSEPDENAESGGNDKSGENDRNEVNVKEDWMGRYMYIPPAMHKQFDDEYERLRYECGRDLEWKPKKNKHYYPVVATKGIEAVADMSPSEFADGVVGLEWFDDSKDELLSE